MADLVFVLVTVVLFAVVGLVVRGGGKAVNWQDVVGLAAAVLLVGYLVVALVKPERF